MALHRMTSITMGVPNVEETAAYYREFGLSPAEDGWFSTRDAGRPLRTVHVPTRRLVDLRIGVDDADDLARAAGNLDRLGIRMGRGPNCISAADKATGTVAYLEIADRFEQEPVTATRYNGPGRCDRAGRRAPGVLAAGRSCRASSNMRCSARPTSRQRSRSSSWARDSSQRLHQGRRRLPALLHRPSQRPGAQRAGLVPAPRLLAGRRHRRSRQGRVHDARGPPGTARLGLGPALRRVQLLLVP